MTPFVTHARQFARSVWRQVVRALKAGYWDLPIALWSRVLWGSRPLHQRLYILLWPWLVAVLLIGVPAAIHAEKSRSAPALAWRLAYRMLHPLIQVEQAALSTLRSCLLLLLRPWTASTPGELAVAIAIVMGSALAASLSLGGPVWAVIIAWRSRDGAPAQVCGRGIREVSLRVLPREREQAQAQKAWCVGLSATGREPLRLGWEARNSHVWITGATGVGKTQSALLPLARSDIQAGRTLVFIDGKGDRLVAAALWSMAQAAGRAGDFRYFDLRRPECSSTYSPFLSGTGDEQADRIMGALRWENEYYRAQSHAVLLRVMRALESTGLPYSLDHVRAATSDLDSLRRLIELTPDPERQAELASVAQGWKSLHVETAGMRAQLDALLLTNFGALLAAPQPDIIMTEVFGSRSIVYFALPVARFPVTAPLIAKLIIGDLNGVAGMVEDRQVTKAPAAIVIDEFAAFAMPDFINLLNKARSADMGITICHQAMRSDLLAAGPGFEGQVSSNTNVKICMRQGEDAEYFANLLGTRRVEKRTDQTEATLLGEGKSGLGSVREADEYLVSPNVIRSLGRGRAVVRVDQPRLRVDALVLDFVDTSSLRPFEPVPQIRPPQVGIDLHGRARPSSGVAPCRVIPPVSPFEGA